MTTIKETFESKINSNQIKQKVIQKRKKQRKIKYATIITCLVILLIPTFFKPTTQLPISNPTTQNSIHINSVKGMELTKLDMDVKTMKVDDLGQTYHFIKNIPLEIVDAYALYGKKCKDAKNYDVLDSYVLHYNNIRIAFSETNEPIRDYYVSRERPEPSQIDKTECIFHQYKDTIWVTFKHDNIYFDIETTDIAIEEVVELVKTILE